MGKLERQFPDELVIIGVHSAKFPAERAGGSLRDAIQRNEIEHPVINDEDLDIWSRYSVRAWPTLIFVDPQGRVIGKHEGEASADQLAAAVRELIERYDAEGLIDRRTIPGLGRMEPPGSSLAFPAKVLADAVHGRLFIADSGHNRIIVAELDGSAPWVIGSGAADLRDGGIDEAAFHHPQGMALDDQILYVADTRNHALRRVDLAGRQVETIAGTGEPSPGYMEAGNAREIELRSPWDLALQDRTLYIAMAGTHQIWALDLHEDWLRPYAGSGREGIRDGTLEQAWLAQPSGLTIDPSGKLLYVADSETSAIRAVDLPPGEEVRTIVGTGLFDFGDEGGVGDQVRLQHPLGVAAGDGIVYVADSYNHKIKRLIPAERRSQSWLGDDRPGAEDGRGDQARFHEPGGLSLAGNRLYIADTNNHRIRVADTETGEVTTLEVDV